MNASDRIAELQREIKSLESEYQAERDARIKATPRQWEFTFELDNQPHYWEIRPGSQVFAAILRGKVINQQECKDAGWSEDKLRDGAYGYLVNLANGKIIMANGGGSVYINEGNEGYHNSFNSNKAEVTEALEDSERIYKSLETIVACWMENLDAAVPVDVTELITGQRHFHWK